MKTSNINVIAESNLLRAWSQAYLAVTAQGTTEITPLHVTISGLDDFSPEDTSTLRLKLDTTLAAQKKASTATVANTIFPLSLWNPKQDRHLLYNRYLSNVLPAIKRDNPRGTYFQRMIDYCPEGLQSKVNQLESVIQTWNNHNNHRHSALQIAIFDPTRDHQHSQRLGFPCLHQVCFTPHGENGVDGLSVTAFYATQHIWTKGYGNYLGLIRLGRFVGAALNLKLVTVSCFAAKALAGEGHTKEATQKLRTACHKLLE